MPKDVDRSDARVYVSLSSLRSLSGRARGLSFVRSQPTRSILNGRHASRIRGRGLNFEELRGYLPGDDVRSIDWKVTARTGEPHVRVFTEERDRPTLIVVDQRMSMFFGSVRNMKSVTAAEAAALIAYRILDQGDRLGGIVFGDSVMAEIRPKRSRRTVEQFVTAIADANALLRADAATIEPIPFNVPLENVARIAQRDHLIIILSDFEDFDNRSRVLLEGLARRNEVIFGLVTDPSAYSIPDDLRFVISNGILQAELNTGERKTLRALAEFSSSRIADLNEQTQRAGVPLLPLNAGEETLPQLRRLFGLPRMPSR